MYVAYLRLSTEGKLNECIHPFLSEGEDIQNRFTALRTNRGIPSTVTGTRLYRLYANNFMQRSRAFRGENPKTDPIHCTVHPVQVCRREVHKINKLNFASSSFRRVLTVESG